MLLFEFHITDFKFGEKCLLSVINNNPYESKILKVKLFRSLIVLCLVFCLFSPFPLYHHAVTIKGEWGWVAVEFLMKLDESKFKIGKKIKPPAEMLHVAQ